MTRFALKSSLAPTQIKNVPLSPQTPPNLTGDFEHADGVQHRQDSDEVSHGELAGGVDPVGAERARVEDSDIRVARRQEDVADEVSEVRLGGPNAGETTVQLNAERAKNFLHLFVYRFCEKRHFQRLSAQLPQASPRRASMTQQAL